MMPTFCPWQLPDCRDLNRPRPAGLVSDGLCPSCFERTMTDFRRQLAARKQAA